MFLSEPVVPPGPFRTLLFDVDGTLVDSADLIVDSLEEATRVHLGVVHPREAYLALFGRPASAQMQILGGDRAPEMLQTAFRYYFANVDRERPFPGCLDTLAVLTEAGYKVALVTSKTRMELDATLEHIPLHNYSRVIITSELTTRPKPFPDPIYLALQTLEIGADHALFIGDSPYDLQAGRAAGVKTGAATWGPHPRATLEAEAPDYLFGSFREVLEVLRC